MVVHSDSGRLVLALGLALSLHIALLFSIPIHEWRLRPPLTAIPFKLQRALPEPVPILPPSEPVSTTWLLPVLPKSLPPETIRQEPVPEPQPVAQVVPKPRRKPMIKPAPLPVIQARPKPVAKLPVPAKKVVVEKAVSPAKSVTVAKAVAPPPRVVTKPVAPPVKPAMTAQPMPAPVARGHVAASTAKSGRLDSTALLGQIADLETAQQRKEAVSASSRTQRVSLTDTRSAAGFYAADWARKVTRVGEMNFPDTARRLETGAGPLLEVAIRADGRLQTVRVLRSSGHAELDQAAQQIVKLAAPYPPFPAELRQEIDLLKIESPWRFDPGGRVRAR